MKRKFLILGLLMGSMAFAEPIKGAYQSIVNSDNEIGFSLDMPYNRLYYPSSGARFKGYGFGAGTYISFMKNLKFKDTTISNVYGKFSVSYNYTKTNSIYNNNSWNEGENITNINVELGKGFMLPKENTMFIPYVFAGYNKMNLGENDGNPHDYEKKWHNYTLGIGTKVQYAMTKNLIWTANFNIGTILDPYFEINYNEPIDGETSFEEGSTHLVKTTEETIGIQVDYKLPIANKKWHLFGGISYTHQDFGDGPINLSGTYEINSAIRSSWKNTINYQAGIAYNF